MSDLELERAAMAPSRWIELCSAFQKQNSNDSMEMLPQRKATRIINLKEMAHSFFIVPGGRFLVTAGLGLFVWDLGYVSTFDCKLVASVALGYNFRRHVVTSPLSGLVLISGSSR